MKSRTRYFFSVALVLFSVFTLVLLSSAVGITDAILGTWEGIVSEPSQKYPARN